MAFRITLERDGRATLKNTSRRPQPVLHSLDLQPSQLRLVNAAGQEVTPFDARAIKKLDNTVYRESFELLAPGAAMPLFTLEVRGPGGRRTLRWGPFHYQNLGAGDYRASVVWVSEEQTYLDATGGLVTMPGVTRGRFASNEITLFVD